MIFSKISCYVKIYDGKTKRIYFSIEIDDFLEKHNTISDKVGVDIKNEFIVNLFIVKKKSKTKIKYYGYSIMLCYNKDIHKVNSDHTCIAVINLDSALNENGKFYPQAFFKER